LIGKQKYAVNKLFSFQLLLFSFIAVGQNFYQYVNPMIGTVGNTLDIKETENSIRDFGLPLLKSIKARYVKNNC
jgi:hypothetical protein